MVVRYSQNLTITHFSGAAPATDEKTGAAPGQTVIGDYPHVAPVLGKGCCVAKANVAPVTRTARIPAKRT
jgi:hypothetical protein